MSYWAQTLYAILKRFILPTMYFNQIIRSFILTTMYFDQIIFAFILNQKLWFLFSKKKMQFLFLMKCDRFQILLQTKRISRELIRNEVWDKNKSNLNTISSFLKCSTTSSDIYQQIKFEQYFHHIFKCSTITSSNDIYQHVYGLQ
jgi:hypothetical protein